MRGRGEKINSKENPFNFGKSYNFLISKSKKLRRKLEKSWYPQSPSKSTEILEDLEKIGNPQRISFFEIHCQRNLQISTPTPIKYNVLLENEIKMKISTPTGHLTCTCTQAS